MLKFFEVLFPKPVAKPSYTICAKCIHYNHPGFSFDFGEFSDNCYAKIVVTKHISFITGEKSTGYRGTPELCSEKNTGHCPDFEQRHSLFNR